VKICKYVFIHLDISVFCCGDLVDNKVILPETKCKQINVFDQVFFKSTRIYLPVIWVKQLIT
jgi:hypothetical protein